MVTIDWLAYRSRISPHKPALLTGDQGWSYAELNTMVSVICRRLAAAGVRAGHHTAVLMPNRVEHVVLIHALARIGAVLVPLNIRLTPGDLRWQVEHATCRWVICSRETEAQAGSLHEAGRRILSVDTSQSTGVRHLNDLSDEGATSWSSGSLDLEAVQGIIYTSGTTGHPKGAMLTFGNHLWSATASAYRLGADPADRWLLCMPLYHVGGLAIVLRCCLYGTAIVLQAGFDPEAVSQALGELKVTLISVVPTMLHRLLDQHHGALSASSLRCILVGGAAATPNLVDKCRSLGLPLATTYGLTEAASQVATAVGAEASRKPGHVGKPLMFSSAAIVDDNGLKLPPDEIGEIVVGGPTLMQGYYRQPEETLQVMREGLLYTGDLGYLDQDGDLWVVQRRSDLIVTGGENVYPSEIEQVFRSHPKVKDAAVVGITDREWGQKVAAAVSPIDGSGLTTEELRGYSRTHLAGFNKQPRLIRFVADLPRTSSGKIQRDKVKVLLDQRQLDE